MDSVSTDVPMMFSGKYGQKGNAIKDETENYTENGKVILKRMHD